MVTKSKQHFGELIFMRKILILMEVFAIWFEEHPCKILKDHELNVIKF
jgi:hypothetical protein